MKPFVLAIVALLALSAFSYAGCSENSYVAGCSSCKFDNATGKFDRSCTDAKKNEGIACLSASYPIAMSNYKAGNCSAVDTCISDLNYCTADASSGNETADCAEGSMRTCYSMADTCFNKAAQKCSDIKMPACGAPASLALIAGGASIFAALFGRKKALCPSPACG